MNYPEAGRYHVFVDARLQHPNVPAERAAFYIESNRGHDVDVLDHQGEWVEPAKLKEAK